MIYLLCLFITRPPGTRAPLPLACMIHTNARPCSYCQTHLCTRRLIRTYVHRARASRDARTATHQHTRHPRIRRDAQTRVHTRSLPPLPLQDKASSVKSSSLRKEPEEQRRKMSVLLQGKQMGRKEMWRVMFNHLFCAIWI